MEVKGQGLELDSRVGVPVLPPTSSGPWASDLIFQCTLLPRVAVRVNGKCLVHCLAVSNFDYSADDGDDDVVMLITQARCLVLR